MANRRKPTPDSLLLLQPLKRDVHGKWRSGGGAGDRGGGNPGPFLYSPFQKEAAKGAEPVVWVVGEVAQVVVELANPCGFEVGSLL